MAWPANLGVYGLNPINLEGGRVYSGATRRLPINTGTPYAYNIGYGDLVTLDSSGYITRVDTTSGAKTTFASSPIGVFVGCMYTPSTGLKQPLWAQSWPASQACITGTAYAIVVDDPYARFKAVATNGSGVAYTASGPTIAFVGQNAGYYQAAGTSSALINTATGDSVLSINFASAASTATLPFKVVGIIPDTALSDGTFQEVVVEYNAPSISATYTSPSTVTVTVSGGHMYRNPTGTH